MKVAAFVSLILSASPFLFLYGRAAVCSKDWFIMSVPALGTVVLIWATYLLMRSPDHTGVPRG